jgi:hypothetical protein
MRGRTGLAVVLALGAVALVAAAVPALAAALIPYFPYSAPYEDVRLKP